MESEILAVLETDPAAWSPTALKSETLVYLIRWLWRCNDQKNIGRLIECLGKRIAQIARDFASGFPPNIAEEFAIEIAEEVNLLIFTSTPSRQSEILEIVFRRAIERRAINKRSKLKERLKHECSESRIQAKDIGEDNDGVIASHSDGKPDPGEIALLAEAQRLRPEQVRKALAAISNPLHREAVILHHLQGWQISSTEIAKPTLSTHFKKSPRQIQNWLKGAMMQMRTALGESI
ncbi:MAG: hypothetical protein KDA90_02750 [Planctomycetaceae bacterium]|nr:hypothetical protein [Planctomycetaceae bacterium]